MVSCWGVTKHIQSKSMTTHQTNPELLNTVLQLLTDQGVSDGFAEGIRRSVAEIHGTEVTAKWDVIWKPPPRNVHCANRPGHHQPKPE